MSQETLDGGTTGAAVDVKSNSMATAGLVLSLVTFLVMFIPYVNFISFFTWILAVVFSAIGISRSKKMNGKGKGAAIAGLVISLVQTLILVVLLIVGGAMVAALM